MQQQRAALARAVQEGDAAALTGLPGVGKKTAERLIVELRDNEVTLKVDENANTRIKFDRNAIEMVMDDKSG